jgi:hypothetical protein
MLMFCMIYGKGLKNFEAWRLWKVGQGSIVHSMGSLSLHLSGSIFIVLLLLPQIDCEEATSCKLCKLCEL